MKLYKLLIAALFILMLSHCDLFSPTEVNVIGIWNWDAATDDQGADLFRDHKYHTLEFKNNMTYAYSIDTFLYEGVYEVDEGADIIRFDYNKVWEILKSNDNQLWIRNLTDEKHEWHLKK